MKFSPRHYSLLKNQLDKKYSNLFQYTIDTLNLLPNQPLKKWVLTNKEHLHCYTNINWHFLQLVNHSLFFSSQHPNIGKNEFGEKEDLVFEKWNQSEFADIFLKTLNQGYYLGKANLKTLRIFNQHLITFAQRHILKKNKISKSYRHQTSLGEYIKNKEILLMKTTILSIDQKQIHIKSFSEKEGIKFSKKIKMALEIIHKLSPSSWERFLAFTDVIIPIRNRQFVSYSHQDLPGYSMINLYHRDFVDLMDDLLHENGHHHMNHYLNLDKLIEEPIDNIYYSPWRKTLRPLRGIYHAYFTFFWAFKLFSDLIDKAIKNDFYEFNSKEIEKIRWRALEEYYMLNFSFNDLKWAKSQKLITAKGWKLICEQQKEIEKRSPSIKSWERKLKLHKKDLIKLKKTLKLAQTSYSKE